MKPSSTSQPGAAVSAQLAGDAMSAAFSPSLWQVNPQVTNHRGAVKITHGFRDTSTVPVGVNFFGVVFEDAAYSVLEDLQNKHGEHEGDVLYRAWERGVLDALREGKASGESLRYFWEFVPAKKGGAL